MFSKVKGKTSVSSIMQSESNQSSDKGSQSLAVNENNTYNGKVENVEDGCDDTDSFCRALSIVESSPDISSYQSSSADNHCGPLNASYNQAEDRMDYRYGVLSKIDLDQGAEMHFDQATTVKSRLTIRDVNCAQGRACDSRLSRDIICANCLLEFHLNCVASIDDKIKGCMINGTAENIINQFYYVCEKCNEELNTNTTPVKVSKKRNSLVALPENQQRENFMLHASNYYRVLKCIFKHLIVLDLLRARLVCHLWNSVALLPENWNLAPLKGCQIKDWAKATVFFRDRKVETLDFFGLRNYSVITSLPFFNDVDFLKGLNLGCVTPSILTAIGNCSKALPKLKVLKFILMDKNNLDVGRAIGANLELLRSVIYLKELTIMAGQFLELLTDHTANRLVGLTRLTHLTLLDFKFLDASQLQFVTCLQSLRHLSLGSCRKWTVIHYELLMRLNIESLTLEYGDTLPNDYLSRAVASLSNLKHLKLVKFSICSNLISVIGSKTLQSFTVWPDFSSSSCLQTWRNLVGGLSELQQIEIFFLGIGSKDLIVVNDSNNYQYREIFSAETGQFLFGVENPLKPGSMKMLHIDDFATYVRCFIPHFVYKHVKDNSLFATRSF